MRGANSKHRSRGSSSDGFTLIELMITMAISALIVTAIHSAYTAQQRSYLAQEQVAEMQQNIRAGMMILTQNLMLAGYDPAATANAGITAMLPGRVQFTLDITDAAGTALDGDGLLGAPGEMIDIGFSVTEDATGNGIPDTDADGDGVPDPVSLRKQTVHVNAGTVSGFQPFADNFQAVEFRYLDSADAATAVPSEVRSLQVSLLARARRPDRQFTNTQVYTPASGVANNWGPYNDNFRRRLLISTINLRNMGL